MKMYLIKRTNVDGSVEYRTGGYYDRWTKGGKCWVGGGFKSFLNYHKGLIKKLLDMDNVSVVVVDLIVNTIVECEFKDWVETNLE